MRIILASASPYRKKLLESIGIHFETIVSTVQEHDVLCPEPAKRAELLAQMKAEDIAKHHPDALVIGSDTVLEGPNRSLLEKPIHEEDARRMLRLQSGNASLVHSGLSIAYKGKTHTGIDTTTVIFTHLTTEEIDAWIASGNWQNCSGALQIEGLGQFLIERLEGDYTGVIGLPLFLLGKLFEEAGVKWRELV
ncbi:septum formation protein Maf [Candidatus Peregrinibacteria bacterium CG10_big_fil_rev_8_21_14_0_10_49_16]|nr:MAG: septum formation protein Maf [Candidatus Peregrinibacteria bacterium CG22_combo_CG10-13_8_21_14_all_49_11]PIR52025.1 MAG: septum formation protein Maf [Candidatus Peregrinibacteria bacterium CG10_big_fil_rev_8_21_14_0_10_49_16]